MANSEALQPSTDNAEKPMSATVGLLGNIWFLVLSALACFATQTYIEFVVAFGIHYLVFLAYALPFRSEKLYDQTGMISFISVTIASFVYHGQSVTDIRSLVLSLMLLLWTLRLGLFLFWRILQHSGSDSRFDTLRPSALPFQRSRRRWWSLL